MPHTLLLPHGGVNLPPILLGMRRLHFIVQTITNMLATDGRRPVYLTVLPIFAMGSLGVALARNVPQLLLFRVVQAFGGGGGMSIGAGVISDIYRLEQRGTAMGVFFAVSETVSTWRTFSCPANFLLSSLVKSFRPVAFPDCRWSRGSLCIVAGPATRTRDMQFGLVRCHATVPP